MGTSSSAPERVRSLRRGSTQKAGGGGGGGGDDDNGLLQAVSQALQGRSLNKAERAWVAAAQAGIPFSRVRDELRGTITTVGSGEAAPAPASAEEKQALVAKQAQAAVEMIKKDIDADLKEMKQGKGLMRSVKLATLTGEDQHPTHHLRGDPWAADAEQADISRFWFGHTEPAERVDLFISHSWNDDGNAKMMDGLQGDDLLREFSARKATAMQNVVRTVKELRGLSAAEVGELTFWMDKPCIPQFAPDVKSKCIQHLERFLEQAGGLIVLMNPKYLTRLWCIFEWTHFLVLHSPEDIFVNVRSFLWEHNVAVFIDNVRRVTVKGCECLMQLDHTILERKVGALYKSEADFERFLRLSLIALCMRDFLAYPDLVATPEAFGLFVQPWMDLAAELGFDELHAGLSSFDFMQVYHEDCARDDSSYQIELKAHFSAHVYPVLASVKHEVIKS
ncbi:Hypothetical protein SCF082_LOCUS4898 [Durusdinium trenchii]|uniref:Uncharacterized protein n=1 Tax=Durusdinium trenchii TaxID=1381693 RepID=A0ABP0I257_9DINO